MPANGVNGAPAPGTSRIHPNALAKLDARDRAQLVVLSYELSYELGVAEPHHGS
jgi:hypothetical protein